MVRSQLQLMLSEQQLEKVYLVLDLVENTLKTTLKLGALFTNLPTRKTRKMEENTKISQEIVEEALHETTGAKIDTPPISEVPDVPPDNLTAANDAQDDEPMEIEDATTALTATTETQETSEQAETIPDHDEDEVSSQKSADEVIQTEIQNEDDDGDNEDEDEEEEFHLSKEENDLLQSDERLDPAEAKAGGAPAWAKGLTQDDIDQIYKLGSLLKIEVIAEVKKLYDQSYKLGVQEAKEMTRGRYLNIFNTQKKKP